MEIVRKATPQPAAPIAAGGRYPFTLSSNDVDRLGDVIDQRGWNLASFSKHAVALWNHNTGEPVGQWHGVTVRGDQLEGALELYPEGASPRADMIRRVLDKGFPLAASVGFRPLETRPRPEGRGSIYIRSDLVECSIVSVPANASCLGLARSLGLSEEDLIMSELVTRDAPTSAEPLEPEERQDEEQRSLVPALLPPPPQRVPQDLKPVPSPAVMRRGGERPYSVLNVVRFLAGDQSVDIGREREMSAEIAYRNNIARSGLHVPLLALLNASKTRAGEASTLPYPAATPGTPVAGAWSNAAGVDLLNPELVGAAMERELLTGRLGVRVLTSTEREVRIPVVTGKPTVAVVALDAVIPLSTVPVAAASLQPVEAGTRVEIRRSAMYAHGAEATIGSLIMRAIIEKIDQIVIAGNTSPALPGLLTIATASATTEVTNGSTLGFFLAEADAAAGGAKKAAVLMDARSEIILGNKVAFTGATIPVTDTATLKTRNVVIAMDLPETTGSVPMLAGDFSRFVLALFGPAATLESNPYATNLWERGAFELRAIQDFSTGVTDASAILKTTTDSDPPALMMAGQSSGDNGGEATTTKQAAKK